MGDIQMFGIGNSAPKKGPTPAAKLHTRYNVLTGGRSSLNDWKLILTRGVSPQQADCLINYFEGIGYLPKTSAILSHLDKHLADAAKDPVAQKYPYSQWAVELAETLDREGNPVPPEYIQAARDNYTEVLKGLAAYPDLWAKLPPASTFIHHWFTDLSRFGSLRMRYLYSGHPKLKQFIGAHARAEGIYRIPNV